MARSTYSLIFSFVGLILAFTSHQANAQWVTGTITASSGSPVAATYSTGSTQSQVATNLYFNSRFGWINNLGARACMDFISGNNSTAPSSTNNSKELCLDDGQYVLLTDKVPVGTAAYLRMVTSPATSGHAAFFTW